MASKSQATGIRTDPERSANEAAKQVSVHLASDQEIRVRAHEIFLERGAEPGDELSDWLQAEQELRRSSP
jgi:hypothetical protein